jgi:hypothetical protein
MRWKPELPKMPRLPMVSPSAHAEGPAAPLGPPPAPSAYRQRNPYERPPADYRAPSLLAEHKGLALAFLAVAIAFALYCWKAPHRSVALDAATRGSAAEQSPIYVEPLPDKH